MGEGGFGLLLDELGGLEEGGEGVGLGLFFFGGEGGRGFRLGVLIYYLNLLMEMTASMRIITPALLVANCGRLTRAIGLR